MNRRTALGLFAAAIWLQSCASTIRTPQLAPHRADLAVMTSGGYAEALDRLAPDFERQSGLHITIIHGSSAGGAADSIPERLKRGEPADVVVLSRQGLALLQQQALVQAGTDRDLVRSRIGMAVRVGAPVPDISTPDKFVAVMLNAPSIGYSASASGTYLSTTLWPRLGLAAALLPKSKRILSERVGSVVARGEVAIGFQQMSELLPIQGIVVVGPIPDAYQKVTVFTLAKTLRGAGNPASDRLLRFLTSRQVARQVAATGLEPIDPR
ncbi:substrate-binding domain-containing protein [Sphingomonas sp. SUN039]|uniref:substrate-binding domain-containing protein n=1 Tax=Sphingomonas sp. SUN039 TaxID=2937787 RepID=UPI002164515A|nr:substrate-binding domain-containing protein [Sphingomonas sp. SUN039]UVO54576.1 substrate-binding domain-containing protein [Sphingomonas sp. SUN039]